LRWKTPPQSSACSSPAPESHCTSSPDRWCARVDFVDTISAGELERACVRIDTGLREDFPELDEIFIQPTSRSDETVRRRVQQRYGRAMAEE
jgi:hypothetical protein